MKVQLLDRAHHIRVQTGFGDVGFHVNRQYIKTDRVLLSDAQVVLVIAGTLAQLGGTDPHIADNQLAAFPGTGNQQHQTDCKDHQRGTRRRQDRQPPPQLVLAAVARLMGCPGTTIQRQPGQDDRQHHLVGKDHQQATNTG